MGRLTLWFLVGLTLLAVSSNDLQVSAEVGPTESECQPYIEKAIKELKTGDTDDDNDSNEAIGGTDSKDNDGDDDDDNDNDNDSKEKADESTEKSGEDDIEKPTDDQDDDDDDDNDDTVETVEVSEDNKSSEDSKENEQANTAEDDDSKENTEEKKDDNDDDDDDDDDDDNNKSAENEDDDAKSSEATEVEKSSEDSKEDNKSEEVESSEKDKPDDDDDDDDNDDDKTEEKQDDSAEDTKDAKTEEDDGDSKEAADDVDSKEDNKTEEQKDKDDQSTEADDDDDDDEKDKDQDENDSKEDDDDQKSEENASEQADKKSEEDQQSEEDEETGKDNESEEEVEETVTRAKRSTDSQAPDDDDSKAEDDDSKADDDDSKADDDDSKANDDDAKDDDDDSKADEDDSKEEGKTDTDDDDDDDDHDTDDNDDSDETTPEDDLLLEGEIPENLRDRKHISELLHLNDEDEEEENAQERVAEIILRDIKRIYENAIKPLEVLYKYRDLSNRHFSDPEIFSKPLVLFMGPWSGGKSSIINYLTDNEFKTTSLRSGAEPSPAYFNILMWGNQTEVLDGTQLAADWTFSGLQKFGQGLEERLRGLKMPNKLLEKVNIVEIPGILEVRKQVSRHFPFNDACQWFIDRADIIFLIYDPAKLDVGPETEAILDQLKGREYQTRIVLNKADTIKPEELLRVQSALIWNISPLMSSAQPPVMYTTSLWSKPYDPNSPIRLLQAQERAFLRDLRTAVDKRIENRIASARRFAVRVRNHAKMVDCYLNTYYNHKTIFGNKKRISDEIIENPQNYHIYEGLSTLTNISRYDLPDPDVYKDFFRLNPLYEFNKLSQTCTYFRGCPINKLDVAIAYDLPELVGKYKKMTEEAIRKIDSKDAPKGTS